MWNRAWQLSGSIPARATPFAVDGAIDREALERTIDRQLAAGTRALVIAGSTGEAAMLDDDEYAILLRWAVEATGGRVPLIAGCGLSGTERTLVQTRRARDCGVDAALVVAPPYVRPTQAGLIAHYTRIVERGGLPLLLYNVPVRAAADILPDTVMALAEVPGILGIKEAVPDADRMRELLDRRPPGFAVLSGDDPTALAALLAGADGVVSVASNVVPGTFARLCELARTDAVAAQALDLELQPLYRFLACAPNPIPLKAVLAQLSLCEDAVRLPLLPLAPELRGTLPELAAAASAAERSRTA